MAPAASLFGQDHPPGLLYREHFITAVEESTLLDALSNITFGTFEMRGVVARRRVAFFGESYDGSEAKPFPDFLVPLRHRIAEWAGIDAEAFVMCLVNEYPAGAPIGWHRDAPQYDLVAGVSLLSTCRMKFRRYQSPSAAKQTSARRVATHEIVLDRRSAYLMTGESRNAYEHHVPAVTHLRYSITFRSLR